MNLDERVCRTCLEKRDELFYIYDRTSSKVAVAEMIMTCTTLVVCCFYSTQLKLLINFYSGVE